jgi:hypothetical protein
MNRRYILRIEMHKGHKPYISFKRAPYDGQRIKNGNFPGTLRACQTCSGEGYLHELDNFPQPISPEADNG